MASSSGVISYVAFKPMSGWVLERHEICKGTPLHILGTMRKKGQVTEHFASSSFFNTLKSALCDAVLVGGEDRSVAAE
jgi:hypothetical protein